MVQQNNENMPFDDVEPVETPVTKAEGQRPYPSDNPDDYYDEKPASGNINLTQSGGNWRSIVAMVAVAGIIVLAAIQLWVMPNVVSKTDFDYNMGLVVTDMGTVKSELAGKASVDQLQSLTDAIIGVQETQDRIDDSLAGKANISDVTTLTHEFNEIQDKLDTLPTKADVDEIKAMVTDVDTLKTQMGDITTSVTGITQILDEMVEQVGLLQEETGISPDDEVDGNVVVQLIGNPFTGSTIVSLSPMAANNTQSQMFSFAIDNDGQRRIENIKLAIGLQLLDANHNLLVNGLPTDALVSLSSSNAMTLWMQQNTGFAYLLGFTNTSSTGLFDIGSLNQDAGRTVYNVSITVTTGNTPITSQLYMYPVIKLINYE